MLRDWKARVEGVLRSHDNRWRPREGGHVRKAGVALAQPGHDTPGPAKTVAVAVDGTNGGGRRGRMT